jgi:hydroxypyruvate isomerase
MNLSVCTDAVFNGLPVEESFSMLKEAGFEAYEFWSWWDKDLNLFSELQMEFGIKAVAICTKFISLTNPSQRDVYLNGLAESLLVSEKLGCGILISQVGDIIAGQDRRAQHMMIVEGLKKCVPYLEDAGGTLAIEPLNTVKDHKGYYLSGALEAFEIVGEVGSANVKVLYDIYHQAMTGDFSIDEIVRNIDKIAHFHAAGFPDRHELDTGTLDYYSILMQIYNTGYKGHVGLEYFPANDPQRGLKEIYNKYQGNVSEV